MRTNDAAAPTFPGRMFGNRMLDAKTDKRQFKDLKKYATKENEMSKGAPPE